MSSPAASPPPANPSPSKSANTHRAPKTDGAPASSPHAAAAKQAHSSSASGDEKREKSRKLDTKHGFVKQVNTQQTGQQRTARRGEAQTNPSLTVLLVGSASCALQIEKHQQHSHAVVTDLETGQAVRRDEADRQAAREKERARQEGINRAHQAQLKSQAREAREAREREQNAKLYTDIPAAANGHVPSSSPPASAPRGDARGGRGTARAAGGRAAAAPRAFSGDRKWADDDGATSPPVKSGNPRDRASHPAATAEERNGQWKRDILAEERLAHEQSRKPVNEQAFYKPGRAGRDVAAGAEPQQTSASAASSHHNPPRGHLPAHSAAPASASSAHPSRPPIAHTGASHPAPAAASQGQPQQPTRPPVPFRANKPLASPAPAASPVSAPSVPAVSAPRPYSAAASAPASSPSPMPSPTASPPPPVGTKQYAAWERARQRGEQLRAEAAKQPSAGSRGAGKNAPVAAAAAAAASNEPHRISYAAMAAKQPAPGGKERSDSEKRTDAASIAAAPAPASSSAAPAASVPHPSPASSPSSIRDPLMSFNVETADSGLQLLSVFEGDDPREVAARFCRTHKHESMQEAIAIIIMENIAAMGLSHKIKQQQ